MFTNIQNYQITIITIIKNLIIKFYNLTNCKCASSQVCICMKKYQITKITKITKLQIASAFLHIYKFAHAKFACFHTCMYYKIIKL
jgi:hypothetical protein